MQTSGGSRRYQGAWRLVWGLVLLTGARLATPVQSLKLGRVVDGQCRLRSHKRITYGSNKPVSAAGPIGS